MTTSEEFVNDAIEEGEVKAEVERLAKLSAIQYDQEREAAAEKLGIRVGTLDMVVKAARPAPTKSDGFLPHWNVEPWPEPVDGAALLEELRAHLKAYVVLYSRHAEVTIPLWVLHTWVFDAFDITPYLAITSPSRRCGKSLLMTILFWLCCRAKKNDSMSKAAIYRSVEADRPTLVLDEVGWVLDLKDERQGILCGGFERLGHVEVCEGESNDIRVKRFSTYCPKAFGLIGKLTATLMDRSIEIAMQRKLKEKVSRLRRRDNEQHAALRRKCLRWANDNKAALAQLTPKLPDSLNDRALDIWEPLLTIAARAGGEWPKLAKEAAIALSGGESASDERGIELLRDIKAAFAACGQPAITTKSLIAALIADEERPWATYFSGRPITAKHLGALLAPFAIVSDTIHPNETGEPKAKGYRLARFEDAFGRYLTPIAQDEPKQTYMSASADETGITDDFSHPCQTSRHVYEKCEKPANDGDSHGCTDKNPNPEPEHHSGHSNGGSRPFQSDTEDAKEELASRTAGACIYCGAIGAEPLLHHNGLSFHRSCRLQSGMEMPT